MAPTHAGSSYRFTRAREALVRALGAFRPWREEPWPLRGWAEMPTGYKLAIAAWLVCNVAVVLLMWPALLGTFDPALIVVSGALTVYLCGVRTRENTLLNEEPQIWIATTLALAGRPLEALVCVIVGSLIRMHRKRIVVHLGVLNLSNDIALVALITLVHGALVDTAGPVTAQWMAAALIAGFCVPAAQTMLVHLVISLGGYCSLREALASWANGARTQGAASAPLAVMTAALMHDRGAWSAVLLLVPTIVSAALSVRTEQATRAQEESVRDHLTGLPNRKAFEAAFASAATAQPGGTWLCVCDLDSFKQLNDTLGHDAGDHALVEAARAMSLAAEGQQCFRYGGDEFVVLCTDASTDDVTALAARICSALEATVGFLGVGVSIGAHCLRADDDVASAVSQADMAMYLAKRAGGNTCCLSSELERWRSADAGDDVLRIGARAHEQQSADALNYWTRSAQRARDGGSEHDLAKALYQLYWHDTETQAEQRLRDAVEIGADTYGWAARAAAALSGRHNDFDAAVAHDARALQIARRRGDRILEITAMLGQAHSRSMLADLEASIALAREARHLARLHASDAWVTQAHMMVIDYLLSNLQLSEAQSESERLVAATSDPHAHLQHARVLLMCDSSDAALHCLDAIDPHALSDDLRFTHTVLHAHAHARSDSVASLNQWHEMLDQLGDTHDATQHLEKEAARALLYLADGRSDESFECMTLALAAAPDASADAVAYARRLIARNACRARKWDALDDLHDTNAPTSQHAPTPAVTLAEREVQATTEAWASSDSHALMDVADTYRELGLHAEAWQAQASAALIEEFHGLDAAIDRLCALSGDAPQGVSTADRAALDAIVEQHGHAAHGHTIAILQQALPGLTPEQYATLASTSSRRDHAAGEPITDASSPDMLNIVARGDAAMWRTQSAGSRGYLVELLHAGAAWGPGSSEADALSERAVIAGADCTIIAVPLAAVLSVARDSAQLQRTLQSLEQSFDRAFRQASLQHEWPVARRLARLLLDLDRHFGHPTLSGERLINRIFTQAELAAMIGTSRKSVSEQLGSLRAAGVVAERGRRLLITDASQLVKAAMPDSDEPGTTATAAA